MIVGEGARQFAQEMGFPLQDLMVPDSKREWEKWREKSDYQPIVNIENHDTIGQLSLDQRRPSGGNLYHEWHGVQNARPSWG